jgi:hypothetical protein
VGFDMDLMKVIAKIQGYELEYLTLALNLSYSSPAIRKSQFACCWNVFKERKGYKWPMHPIPTGLETRE